VDLVFVLLLPWSSSSTLLKQHAAAAGQQRGHGPADLRSKHYPNDAWWHWWRHPNDAFQSLRPDGAPLRAEGTGGGDGDVTGGTGTGGDGCGEFDEFYVHYSTDCAFPSGSAFWISSSVYTDPKSGRFGRSGRASAGSAGGSGSCSKFFFGVGIVWIVWTSGTSRAVCNFCNSGDSANEEGA
jgi:hypothetical protein